MGMDQAAGLRQWASGAASQVDDEACPRHVLETLVELSGSEPATPAPERQAAPARQATPSPRQPERIASPPAASPTVTLMVLGLPGRGERHAAKVTELLAAWSEEGRRWVGKLERWRIVPLDVTSGHLPVLATEQSRWALWVDSDEEAFRRAYRVLKRVAERGGPRRLLAVHPPDVGRKGLLDNLQRVAANYFGIELLVLAR